MAVLLLTACDQSGDELQLDELPADEPMVVHPDTVSPGDRLDVYFPDQDGRGLRFDLKLAQGTSWTTAHYLVSDGNDGDPSHFPVDEEQPVTDVQISGVGPDRLALPNRIPAGDYRVCAGNRCAENHGFAEGNRHPHCRSHGMGAPTSTSGDCSRPCT